MSSGIAAMSQRMGDRKFSLSPINRRRLANFVANRRGFWSAWIFAALFSITLFSDLLANDRPLFVWYDGALFFPIFVSYSETTFGGDFATPADFHDPYVADLITAKGAMMWPPIPFRFDTVDKEAGMAAPARPSKRHLLGTDDQHRDVLARILYGFRLSVLFGVSLTIASCFIGVVAGAVQGYFGGWTDLIFQRIVEIWHSIPALYVLIVIASVIKPDFVILLLVLLLFSWVSLVGVVRAEFLRGRTLDYVLAARALGVGHSQIMVRHLLPNAMVATMTFVPFILNGSITTLTSLDFLGFGLPPDYPSLGELLRQGKNNLSAPWLGLSAFFVIGLMLSLLVFVGEALRDAFDPRKTMEGG